MLARQRALSPSVCRMIGGLAHSALKFKAGRRAPRGPLNIMLASCPCRLLQALPAAQLTIYASRFGSDVTTHGAAGVWMPYKLSETPEVLTDRWAVSQSAMDGRSLLR